MPKTEFSQTLQSKLKMELFDLIDSGKWKEGDMIPSENELCELYGISRITVRNALNELVHEGYLVKYQGKGTFVTSPKVEPILTMDYSPTKDLQSKGITSEFIVVDICLVNPTQSSMELFEINEDDKLWQITRLREIDGGAYAWEKALVPQKILPKITEDELNRYGLNPMIKQASGLFPVSAEEKIEPVICPDNVADAMGIAHNTAVFKIKKNTKSATCYIEKCVSYITGQRLRVHRIYEK